VATRASSASWRRPRWRSRRIAARIGKQALRAAFFQGHVEFLGLAPDGSAGHDLAPDHGAPVRLRVPARITTFAGLAAATTVPEPELRGANPGVSDPIGPASLVMPGCREHVVVTSPHGGGEAPETRALIAAQHGVTEGALIHANPGLPRNHAGEWPPFAAGDRVLVPRH
jgi:hypothetical protein